NSGYLTIESTNGSNNVTNSSLAGSPNWRGGEVVIRKSYFTIDRHHIESHSGNAIQYRRTSNTYNPNKGFGFFIQGHINTLDRFGEWYYNPSTKKVSVYFGSTPPSSVKVQVSTKGDLVSSSLHLGNLKFENLQFSGANKNAIALNHLKGLDVKHVDIEFAGVNAFDIHNLPNVTIENSTIKYSNNSGIQLGQNTENAKIINTIVESTNTIAGLGKSGVGSGYAIEAASDNSAVHNNQVLNTGYIAIRFGGNNTTVLNNYVDGFCLLKDDGSGIYTWTGSSNKEY